MDKNRIKKLQSELRRPILVKKSENLVYLIGRSYMHGYLLVKKNKIVFLGDGLENPPVVGEGALKIDFLKNVGKYVSPRETMELFGEFTYNETEYIKFKNPELKLKVIVKSSPVDLERRVKDAGELTKIKKSMEIVSAVFSLVKKQLPRNIWTEKGLARLIQDSGLRMGAGALSFPPIVASGANAAIPHHIPSGKKIRAGESIVIDFGFKYKNYCSDFTRTVFLKRMPKKLELVYGQVEKAYLQSVAFVRPGMKAGEVYGLAVRILEEKRLGKYFIHSLGHGTGLEIHELPNLSPNSKDIMQSGMVFSIEPGVYIPKHGGVRIEDLVRLTAGGAKKFISQPTRINENIL